MILLGNNRVRTFSENFIISDIDLYAGILPSVFVELLAQLSVLFELLRREGRSNDHTLEARDVSEQVAFRL